MTKYEADYFAMVPVSDHIILDDDFQDQDQFTYEAMNTIRDMHEGASDVDITNITEVE